MNWLGALQRNPAVNSLIKTLRLHRVADFGLRHHPLQRQTAQGVSYQVDSVASLVVANEVFRTDTYAQPVRIAQPQTFIDLGSNVGYFPLLVADVLQVRTLRGLCVEPNPYLHKAIEAHLERNGLKNVQLVRGAVAAGGSEKSIDFFLNPSHIASSVSGRFNPRVAVGGDVERIQVPVVDLETEWERQFPGERVGLLKIDIEGSEIDFLKGNTSFLNRVDAILIEWHKWITTLEEVTGLLQPQGFLMHSVAEEDDNAGTAFFQRRSPA